MKSFLDTSGFCKSVDEGSKSKSKRYLFNYVADRIDYGTETEKQISNSICIIRKADETLKKTANDAVEKIKEKKKIDKTDFAIDDILLFCFNTSICILCFKIVFDNTDYDSITNQLYRLKTYNAGEYKGLLGKTAKAVLEKSFGEENPFKPFTTTSDREQRANVFTYFESEKFTDEKALNKCLFRLSHCYKDEFVYSEDSGDKCRIYKNNENCHWAITSECTACVAYPEVKYVSKFFHNSFEKGYMLLFVLMLNQKYTLYRFQSEVSERTFQNTEEEIKAIKNLQKRFYKFEKDYNFKTVSATSQYQNIYDMLYSENRIDMLIDDVREPLNALNTILVEESRELNEENEKQTTRALAVISLFAVFSALIDMWGILEKWSYPPSGEVIGVLIRYVVFTILTVAVVLGSMIVFKRGKVFRQIREVFRKKKDKNDN
ncbi:MAG: hypothetical protein IJM02_01515 [Clostridia bacterium]|nr:hypothetical protein [Clostridia bacterium]